MLFPISPYQRHEADKNPHTLHQGASADFQTSLSHPPAYANPKAAALLSDSSCFYRIFSVHGLQTAHYLHDDTEMLYQYTSHHVRLRYPASVQLPPHQSSPVHPAGNAYIQIPAGMADTPHSALCIPYFKLLL